ncbi:MAG: hypothetical protein FJ125_11345, partial [Deltaproteobacteria bacterium]|nr:hypothetical protein [Deltaproteobacteria bacterium]
MPPRTSSRATTVIQSGFQNSSGTVRAMGASRPYSPPGRRWTNSPSKVNMVVAICPPMRILDAMATRLSARDVQDDHGVCTPRGVTWLSVSVNLALALAKVVVGHVSRSQTILADGLHSASGLLTDVAVLGGLRVASKPADHGHLYGHRRFTTLMAMLVGLALMAVAVTIGAMAISRLHDIAEGRQLDGGAGPAGQAGDGGCRDADGGGSRSGSEADAGGPGPGPGPGPGAPRRSAMACFDPDAAKKR